LPVVLYRYEVSSLTVRKVLKKVLRIFGPEQEEVAGGWRRLHNEELHNLYASPNVITGVIKSMMMDWAGRVACMEQMRNAYKILSGKHLKRRNHFNHRGDKIEMDLREIDWEIEWIRLAQDGEQCWAVVNTIMNLRVS
jgi:hypothetical protein